MDPIYIIVYEQLYTTGPGSLYGLPRPILAVISCELQDIQAAWDVHVAPLQNMGRHVQVLYLSREPDSFLREVFTHE